MAMDSWIEQGMYIFKGDGTKIIFILRLRIFLFFYFSYIWYCTEHDII